VPVKGIQADEVRSRFFRTLDLAQDHFLPPIGEDHLRPGGIDPG
jgi:hypothetical protein